ncbi:MAG: phospho-sugar mutase [Oscillospiraceae bacterium]|nr:phospho-sugar mutase [Oscillospiraceae bacterium]
MNKEQLNANYELWLEKAVSDPDLPVELAAIKGDDEAILDRFYRELEFGTAGLRGIIGAGPNRMNYYTVRRATQGLALYVKEKNPANPAVAICYDSRIKSDYFSEKAAEVLAAAGVKVYIFKELMPTPVLSYAVRELKCDAGINMTASHNPAKFNGYKAYGADGSQLSSDAADIVLEKSMALDIFEDIESIDFAEALNSGVISYIDDSLVEGYYEQVKKQSIHADICRDAGLKVVYTPLNGAGNKPVRRILADIGITDVTVVPEQELPDGNFPTCPYPNPEFKEALERGLQLCAKQKPDLLLATDPDCDRVGIAVIDDNGEYELFTGNEVGVMLLEYIARERIALGTMPDKPVSVKSVVSTTLTDKICAEYGVELVNVLTGFKHIGEQISILEDKGEEDRFIFAFEESYGYLAGNYCRDKDAVVASMLICEMAAFYRSKGVSLIQARAKMYEKYGVFYNTVDNIAFEGASGMEKMGRIMQQLRDNYPREIAGMRVITYSDFGAQTRLNLLTNQESAIPLPKTNMVFFDLEGGGSLVVRPSGTEPKIKIYYTTVGQSLQEAEGIRREIAAEIKQYFL